MNWKISTARKNKTDIIKPKTPARQGNWNKQKNKQTINPLYEEQYHTTTTTTTTTTDLPRWMDSIELLFLHLPTLNRRWEWITSGLEGSTTRISNRVNHRHHIGPPTPSLAQFQPQLRNIGKKKTKSTKSQFNQCLGSIFFSIPRVFSML